MLLFSWTLEASLPSAHSFGSRPPVLSVAKTPSGSAAGCSQKLPCPLVELTLFPQSKMFVPPNFHSLTSQLRFHQLTTKFPSRQSQN